MKALFEFDLDSSASDRVAQVFFSPGQFQRARPDQGLEQVATQPELASTSMVSCLDSTL